MSIPSNSAVLSFSCTFESGGSAFKHTDDLTPTLTDCSVSVESLGHHHFLKVSQMIQMYSQDSNHKSVLKTIEIKEAFKEITAGYDHGFKEIQETKNEVSNVLHEE